MINVYLDNALKQMNEKFPESDAFGTESVNDLITMTPEQIEYAIDELENIAKHGPSNTLFGICNNLYHSLWRAYQIDVGYELVSALSVGWLHHSVYRDSPIPTSYSDGELWEGKNLELRISLINHIINRLKDAKVSEYV